MITNSLNRPIEVERPITIAFAGTPEATARVAEFTDSGAVGIGDFAPVGKLDISADKRPDCVLLMDVPENLRRATLLEMDAECQARLSKREIDLEYGYTFLALSFSTPECKCSVTYKSPHDVPLENVICEHGNYLLRWGG